LESGKTQARSKKQICSIDPATKELAERLGEVELIGPRQMRMATSSLRSASIELALDSLLLLVFLVGGEVDSFKRRFHRDVRTV
jgi:hypothetical protein